MCWVCRYVGIRSLEPVGVFLPGDQNYPGGGPFDPLNYAADADGFVEQVRVRAPSAGLSLCRGRGLCGMCGTSSAYDGRRSSAPASAGCQRGQERAAGHACNAGLLRAGEGFLI